MASKIEKTIARQKEKIEEGQFYEAHQQLRTITARYLKALDYASAITILHSGALLLLRAGQGGSGGDLSLFLIEVYNKAETKCDAASKGRVLSLLRAFPVGEPTMKKFVNEAVGWSARMGEFPAGDAEVHQVAGQMFAEEGEPYEAERHLALGTRDAPPTITKLEYTWYLSDTPDTAAYYAGRAVFPLLHARNLRGANAALLLFTSSLGSSASHSAPAVQEVSSTASEVRIYPSLPLLNFLSMLLLACQRGVPELFKNLKNHYSAQLRELPDDTWDDALEAVAEMYFGIKKPRAQGNPLFDMMGSMFGGGGGGGAAKPKAKPAQANLAAPGLD